MPYYPRSRNRPVSFALGSFSDPGADGSWQVSVNWDDGSGNDTFAKTSAGSLGTLSHNYANSGPYTVTVRVTESGQGAPYGSATFQVQVVAVSDVLYWSGGNGEWTTDGEDWWDPSASEYTTWDSSRWAVFSGTAGTVSVADSVDVQGMLFLTSGYTLSAIDDGIINAADGGLTVYSAVTAATIGCSITNYSSAGLIKTGTGALTLGGGNSYGGGTTIAAGTLKIASSSAIPSGSDLTVDGTLDLNGCYVTVSGLSGSSTGKVTSSNTSLASQLTVGPSEESSCYFYGKISEETGCTVGLRKTGAGTLILAGENDYSGQTTIQQGTLRVGEGDPNTTGTLGSGVVALQDVPEEDYAFLEFNRAGTATIPNTISAESEPEGSLAVKHTGGGTLILSGVISGTCAVVQDGSGTLILTADDSYTGPTTIINGTLQVGNDTSTGSVGDGEVVVHSSGSLAFNLNDMTTIDNKITRPSQSTGTVTQMGTGTLTLTGDVDVHSMCVEDTGPLVVDSSIIVKAESVTIQSGSTMEVKQRLRLYELSNAGTLRLVPGGRVERWEVVEEEGQFLMQTEGGPMLAQALYNTGTRTSGTDVLISGGSLGNDAFGAYTAYRYEASVAGGGYLTLANNDTSGLTPFTTSLSGLTPGTAYTLRVVATNASGGQIIYDGAAVSTTVETDTSGWYRITDITPGGGGNPVLSYTLISTEAFSAIPPQEAIDALGAPEASFSVVQAPSVASGPSIDYSWIYAHSPQEAVLQSFAGLVKDGSSPVVDPSGVIKLWYVWAQDEQDPDPCFEVFTFERDRYEPDGDGPPGSTYGEALMYETAIDESEESDPPEGGYSAYWHSTPYTLHIEEWNIDPGDPCTSACGCPGGPDGGAGAGAGCGAPSAGTGAAVMRINAIDSRGGSAACGLGATAGLTYDSRETTFDSGYGRGWSDVDELPSLVVARNTMAVRFGAEKALWFDVQQDGTYAARYGAKETLVHNAVSHVFVLTRPDGTRYEFYDAEQTSAPKGALYRSVAPSGATVEAHWTEDGELEKVEYGTSPAVNPYQTRDFAYYTTGGGYGHIASITLSENSNASGDPVWTNVRKITYDYYGGGATWTFALEDPAPQEHYQVFATWVGASQNATNAPFAIFDGTRLLRTERVDQTQAPDSTDEFQLLADLDASLFSSGKLVVQLSDDADGRVVADAIRVRKVVASVDTVVDDGDDDYADDGGWTTTSGGGAYGGDSRFRAGTHDAGAVNLFGLPGDLKTILTEQANGAGWAGNDTNYFRYYIDDADGKGVVHGLKRVVLANAYARLVEDHGDPSALADDVVANYTCFYDEYDADGRVTRQIKFGNSQESNFSSTLSANSNDYNHWYRKSVETRLDGNTTLLVGDIYAGANGSSPGNLTGVGATLFFTANDGTNGIELWRSDGTTAVLVKDIYGLGGSSPGNLTNVGGTLFFTANDGSHGTELWRSDGTDGTTILVKDIRASGDSSPGNLTNVGGTLFFTANDGTHGTELWKTDPTTNATVMVRDIDDDASSSPANLTNVGGVLFFTADDGSGDGQDHGVELWKSDGTTSGTVLVEDIYVGTTGSSPANLTNVNGILFFTADTSADGIELWRSDGTADGTVLVKDNYLGGESAPGNFTNVNGTLFFTANGGTELWKSDGTTIGTVLVKDDYLGGESAPGNFTNVNGTLFFTADEGANGTELWKSDGTLNGTVMVKDICSGATGSSPGSLTNVNGTLFFTADDWDDQNNHHGVELWKSDGTADGTVLVEDICSGATGSSPGRLTNLGGRLFFTANDGSHGTELWQNGGITNTVYTNFLGQTLLTDLWDTKGTSATEDDTHTITYSRYDDEGRLILTVDPAAFELHQGGYYNDTLPDLIDYGSGGSPYLHDDEGLFQVTTYYASTSPGIDEGTAGGVAGYKHQTAVAHGEGEARLMPGTQGGPILVSSYTYFARTVGDDSIYPVASYTTYSGEDGTGAATTSYAYAWYTDKLQIKEEATTLPTTWGAQNGSAIAARRFEYYSSAGNLEWTADELGRFTRYEYESVNNRLTKAVEDVDGDDGYPLPTFVLGGWPSLPGAGQGVSATTDYQHDALGRVTRTLGPAHTADVGGTATNVRTATWTVYKDAEHQTWSAQGYETLNAQGQHVGWTLVNPVSITKTDRDGRVTERIQVTVADTTTPLDGSESVAQSDYTAWTTYQYSKTRLVSMRAYDEIPSEGAGTAGVNYERTSYGYENYNQAGKMGRQAFTTDPSETVQHVFLDARGNVIATWIGTDDVPADNYDALSGVIDCQDFRYWVSQNPTATTGPAGTSMVLVSRSSFDANGNVTESRAYFGAGASDYYTTEYQYDWRERLTDVLSPADVVTHYEFDNLGRTLWTKTYASADFTLTAPELRAQSENLYDRLGRVYESRVYEVAQQDAQYPGTVGDYLPTETWYDARAQVIKTATANGLFQKYAYDGLGRMVASYTSYDADETAYADADDVTGDTVIEQTQTWYDRAGQTVASATYQRLPNDATTTGPLTAANSYATAAVAWYDGLGRTVATADYGREDVGPSWTHYFFHRTAGTDAGGNYSAGDLFDVQRDGMPDEAQATPRVPNSSDDYIVALTEYDDAGRAYRTIDNLGRINETQFDDAGRVTKTIQNYKDGDAATKDGSTFAADQDATVEYQYDSSARLVTMTAVNAWGYNVTAENVTTSLTGGTSNPDTYLLFSVEDLGTRGGGSANGHHFVVVKWSGSEWLYDNGSSFVSFTTCASDVLTASINTSGTPITITGISTQDSFHEVQRGYAASNIAFGFDTDHFTVTAGYFSKTSDQATAYLYGSTINASWQTAVVYPDSTDTLEQNGTTKVWTITTDLGDHVSTQYDRLGRTTQTTDQRGVVHAYAFDTAGRPAHDRVTDLGATGIVDGAVRRISTTYDDIGRVQTVSNYDDEDVGQGAVLNQVKYVYNGWGQVAQEFQEHDGQVDGNLLFVEYGYETGATGVSPVPAKYVRLNQVTNPNGRQVDYDYGSTGAIDDIMSRLSAIFDDADEDGDLDPGEEVFASYKYLGARKIVSEDYEEIDVKLDYAANNLAGLDRFGRVADQVWKDYAVPQTLDEYTYTYDRAGNRITRDNELHSAFDEDYTYDGVNRLTSSVRADSFDQTWTLDGLGNFGQFDDDGTSQTRTVNAVNEITGITGGWATPAYDLAGNMTTIPKPSNPASGLGARYDAWNRLVEISQGANLLAKFSYDGSGRRIEQLTDFDGGTPQHATHYYLNGQNQVLETREGSPTTAPESLQPKYQNVWSARYIDSLVLRDENTDQDGLCDDERLYYLNDANYNVTALVDTSGDVVERYVYSAYGEVTIYDATWSNERTSSDYSNTTLYTGRELDPATGLYYYRARYYSADLGTFVNRDPIGYRGGINLYRYAGDSPVTHADPSGARTCTLVRPPVITNSTISSPTASAAGVQVDPSFSPGTVAVGTAVTARCRANIEADVQYTCTDTIRIYHWYCPPIWTTKTLTYTTSITVHDTIEWDAPIPPSKQFEVRGPALSIGPTGGAGVSIAWLEIPPESQRFADSACAISTAPRWTPPPGIVD